MVTIFNNDCRLNTNQILKPLNHFPPMFPFQAPENIYKTFQKTKGFPMFPMGGQKGTLRGKRLKKVRKDLICFITMIHIFSVPVPMFSHLKDFVSKKTLSELTRKKMLYRLTRSMIRLWSSLWKQILPVHTNFEIIKNSFATWECYISCCWKPREPI